MNLPDEYCEENADMVDRGAIARTGMLIGAYLALAGLLGEHPVLKSMAEVHTGDPSLTPGQTLVLGLTLVAASVARQLVRVPHTPPPR